MGKFSLDEWKKMKEGKPKEKLDKETPDEDILVEVKPISGLSLKDFKKVKEKKIEEAAPTNFISQKSSAKDKNDYTRLRHNRDRYEGYKVGHYVQTPPLVFTRDGHNVFMGDMYRGACAFLILGGPSVGNLNLESLKQPSILTMGINNSVRTFRPNLWMCVDNPQKIGRAHV